ncbi:thioredoxin family protein [Virgibacillus senegalensis]|uniref:thioredoxin family protein n=1 Tax=Virgibacillus senegalensis TaxID=1499679 RepID=UPI00069F9F0C|nr:thioredoxin family protein [Virgibacillus senegalensis]
MLRPVVSSVAEQLDTVDFYYVDVDEAGELAQQFGVQSIPTLVKIKDGGEEADRSVGFMPEEQVKAFAES